MRIVHCPTALAAILVVAATAPTHAQSTTQVAADARTGHYVVDDTGSDFV